MLDIARYWLDKGADGYRLDAIRYLFEAGKNQQADLPETHAYLTTLANESRQVKPDVALIGEVWTDTSTVATYFGKGNELDLCFNFDESGALVGSVNSSNPQELIEALRRSQETYSEQRFSAPFLTNHDMPRVASLLGENSDKMRLAAAVLLSLPGTPFLYQGEEIGLTQGPAQGDEGKRTPMQWDTTQTAGFTTGKPWNRLSGGQSAVSVAAQQARSDSLLHWYQQLIRLRHSSGALSHGGLFGIARGAEAQARVLSLQRASKGEVVVAVFNFGTETVPPRVLPLDTAALADAGLAGQQLKFKPFGPEQESSGTAAGEVEPGAAPGLPLPAIPARHALWFQIQ